eukprot:TRINITY_DN1687_c0_g1_i3.p1 TRINITY_DN1687_c0_g1~~TRINITY_DN1687_c0_g1_i3.p1  ORF type:complete len:361 (+),score=57.82 TRINITY_DN1687_c0_g1_i3:70-1152(+)
MAKIQESDPRWIVEERKDGTNVNNWHWQEKDCIPWTKQRLSQLFQNLELVEQSVPKTSVVVTGLSSVSGEAFLNVRKNKLIPSYELEIKVDWTGAVSGQEIKGQIVFPYVAEENHDEEPEIKVTLFSESKEADQLKQLILKQGKLKILKIIQTFVTEFHSGKPANTYIEETAQPEKKQGQGQAHGQSAGLSNGNIKNENSASDNVKNNKNNNNNRSINQSSKGRRVQIKDRFYTSSRDLFDCFVNEGRVQAYTQSPAKIERKVGGSISMYGGSIQGIFRTLEEGKLLVMDWRFNDWEEGQYSQVKVEFIENEPGNTELVLEQSGIPEEDRYGNVDVVGRVEQGWKEQVFFRIKAVFGYGI